MFSRKMKYFIELAKCESLNEAANTVHITPSAMSQGLSSLERSLGVKLLDKKKQTTIIETWLGAVRFNKTAL